MTQPAIPRPTSSPGSILASLRATIEAVEVLLGARGRPADAAVTEQRLAEVLAGADLSGGAVSIPGPRGPPGPPGPPGPTGLPGEGVPPGGDAGQFLRKASAADYATEWANVPSGGSGNSYFPSGW
jgi:hypothetical protein